MAQDEERVQNLTEAFYETYKQLKEKDFSRLDVRLSLRTAIRLVISSNDFNGFSQEKGARDFVANMGQDKFIDEMCYRYLDSFPSIDEIPDEKVREAYYGSNHANRGHRETMTLLREELINNGENSPKMLGVIINNILGELLFNKEAAPKGMKGIVPNLPNMVKYTGAQKRYYRKALELGEMAAVSDLGRRARTQENSVLLMHHPESSDFKMMVVADGEGPRDKGEIASEIAVTVFERWFNGLNSKYFEDVEKLAPLIISLAKQISEAIEVRLQEDVVGTKFACVIKGKRDTIIANVGDIRVYAVDSKGVYQLTEDDTPAYQYYKEGTIRKESIGFLEEVYKESLLLGLDTDKCNIQILSNQSKYIVATNGVTDFLDLENDPDMIVICKETPREIARVIADKVASTIKMPGVELINGTGFNIKPLEGGNENATVVVYSEKPKKKFGTRFYDYMNIDNPYGEELLNEVGEKIDTAKEKISRGIHKIRRKLEDKGRGH